MNEQKSVTPNSPSGAQIQEKQTRNAQGNPGSPTACLRAIHCPRDEFLESRHRPESFLPIVIAVLKETLYSTPIELTEWEASQHNSMVHSNLTLVQFSVRHNQPCDSDVMKE
jgi:hypothetical protein